MGQEDNVRESLALTVTVSDTVLQSVGEVVAVCEEDSDAE